MKNSTIQWTDHTFNPWIGCTKVAPECKNCYAETLMDKRWGKVRWGKGQPRHRTSAANWRQPFKWNEEARQAGVQRKVFCASLADVWDLEVPVQWRHDLFAVVNKTPNLIWQILTKRPAAAKQYCGSGPTPDNVWLGVSAGVDPTPLLEIRAPVHFLSCEPMLHGLNVNYPEPFQTVSKFDWIIFGGESGHGARTLDVDWIRQGLAFCRVNHISAFVKQLGANVMGRETDKWVRDVRDSHGGDMSEWPEELRVREFPCESEADSVPAGGNV